MMMMQQDKSAGNLNATINSQGSSILPAKSKVVRSYTSSSNNTQNLEQIMKRANEILKKSKNCTLSNGRPDINDILHPLGDSFVTLTTADSLQKNSQSTNREGCKVSPFVTASSPETTESKKSNPHSSDKSSKAKSKLPLGSGNSAEDSANQSARVNIAKQLHNNYTSEADYIFDNFDSVFRVVFNPQQNSSQQSHTNHFTQKQSGPTQHSSFSANARDNDVSCRLSLAEVFERVRREEKCVQMQNKQTNPQQNSTIQVTTTASGTAPTSSIHLRSHSSIINTSEPTSYLVPKQVQQTTSSFQMKNQQNIQSQPQQSIQQQLSSSFKQSTSNNQQQNTQSSHSKDVLNSSQSILNSQQQQPSQQSHMLQGEIDQYLKKPQPAKIKTSNGAPLHPHPPLPQSTKMNINGYNTNHFNAQRFRYRNSLRDKENIPEAANTSIGQLNMSNGQIMTNPNKNNGSFLCTPVAANSNNNNNNGNNGVIPSNQQYQTSIPQQHQQQQQHQIQHVTTYQHQRSSSNILDLNQNILNSSSNNVQQINNNSLQNSFGFYRPRFDSTSGPSNNNNSIAVNNNTGANERLNTVGIDQNIKNMGYASLKERGSMNLGTQMNDISCDKSLNYSSMRVNTSYNGNSQSQNQQVSNNIPLAQSSRTGSFQMNIPKMTVGKQSAASSILNSLIGNQKMQQPLPSNSSNNNNTTVNQTSNNTSINQMAYNPTASTSSLGNRSTSVPRANIGYLLQKKYV